MIDDQDLPARDGISEQRTCMSTVVAMEGPRFRLQRLHDGLIYEFEPESGSDTGAVYRRTDGGARITWRTDFGWSIWDADQLTGRVWDVPASKQGRHPTAGIWVSRKGAKSYVYELVYAETEQSTG